jgi:hypothetical protein
VEDYPFSTIRSHQNPSLLPFQVHHWKWSGDWIKWGNFDSILDWMNTDYPYGFSDYLKKGLRHPKFHIPKSRTTRKIPPYFWKDLQAIYPSVPESFEKIPIEPCLPFGALYLLVPFWCLLVVFWGGTPYNWRRE